MTDDTTTARLDTTDPDRPRGDVGLGDARREALAEALVDHMASEAEVDCIEGSWVYARRCDCGWHGKSGDHQAHVAAALAPLVAGWLGEERAAGWDEGHGAGRDDEARGLEMRHDTPNPYRGGTA